MLVGGFGQEDVADLQPVQAGDDVFRTAQRFIQHLGHFAMTGGRFARQFVGVDEGQGPPASGLHPNLAILALPTQVCIRAFQNRCLETIWRLPLEIK